MLRTVLLVSLVPLFFACSEKAPSPKPLEGADQGLDELREHSKEFNERDVIEVTDGVHVAIGYGLANSILIEGDGGNIVVDTMGSLESAGEVRAAFQKVNDQPIVAVVYTHYHPDHTLGAGAFVDSEDVQVLSHRDTGPAIYNLVTVVRPIITTRSMRMFGNYLGDDSVFNNGIGPTLDIGPDSNFGIVPPNRTFDDRMTVEIAGVTMELVHAPGETDDQIFVWLPDRKALLAGDNFYRSFPNLYTIRGTPYRDVLKWVASIDAMRARSPEHLVPSHTRPISGAERVEDALRDYRDAIQFVHDQTVRYMNQGLTPVEITRKVKLPEHLATSPYLQQLYGRVDWSVRSVFNGYLGYFGGNPTELAPFSLTEEAPRVAELAGGWDSLRRKAEEAGDAGDHQWVLRLTDYLLAHDPDDQKARELRIASLTALGTEQVNPNARHYYLTRAVELRDGFVAGFDSKPTQSTVGQLPVESFVNALPVFLNAEEAVDVERTLVLHFPDVDETHTVEIRRGVAITKTGAAPDPEVEVSMPSMQFKTLLAGLDSAGEFLVAGDFEFRVGNRAELASFLGFFKK